MEHDGQRDLPLDANSINLATNENLIGTWDESLDEEDYISVFDNEYFGVSLTRLIIIVWNVFMFGLMLLFPFGLAHDKMVAAQIFLYWPAGNLIIWLCTRRSISGSLIYAFDPDKWGLMTGLVGILIHSLIIAIIIIASIWLTLKVI
jgi:hypothetical protein